MQQAQALHARSAASACTPRRRKLLRISVSMRSSRGFAAFRLSASTPKVRYLVLISPLLPRGKLALQHPGVLGAELVEAVALQGDGDAPGVGIPRGGEVDEGELEADGGIKIVEEVAPAVENGGLVLVLVELVVDILKLHGFACSNCPSRGTRRRGTSAERGCCPGRTSFAYPDALLLQSPRRSAFARLV